MTIAATGSPAILVRYSGRAPGRGAGVAMNKFERVRLLRHLGLNTENSVLLQSLADVDREASFLSRFDHYSVRTFQRDVDRMGEPHFPFVSKAEFDASCLPLLSEGYCLMVAEPVDPSDALFAGALLRSADGFLVEVATGPGTVRRVTHDGQIDVQLGVRDPREIEDPVDIRDALLKITALEFRWRSDLILTDVVYEFSVYRVPVGWKRQRSIFWEIRGLEGRDTELGRFFRHVVA